VHIKLHVYLSTGRSEAVEKELQLRTKKMREKDEMKMTIRHYRFVLLRIKFPDGIILQGVWTVNVRLTVLFKCKLIF